MLFTFYGGSDSSWAPSYDTHAYFRSAIVLYSCSLCFSPQKLLSFSLRKQNHRDTFLNLLNKKKLAWSKILRKKKIYSYDSQSLYHCISFPIFDIVIFEYARFNMTPHAEVSSIISKKWEMCYHHSCFLSVNLYIIYDVPNETCPSRALRA